MQSLLNYYLNLSKQPLVSFHRSHYLALKVVNYRITPNLSIGFHSSFTIYLEQQTVMCPCSGCQGGYVSGME